MGSLRFTTDAYLDLDEIVRYIGERNPSAATRLINRLEAECEQIASAPEIGQSRADLAPGLRFFPVGTYLIFYRKSDDGIQVIRVLHSARDYGPADF